ncbi:hypothetical protein DL770_001681 [Monosporascus sp. CRB-9-2]|nr:hypothetical protein DL770_001681 [Monosporascus sp. CRB-9-2]
MASNSDPVKASEKQFLTTETNPAPAPGQPYDHPGEKRSCHVPAAARAWAVLFVHGACCVAVALAVAFGLDGYMAGDESSPHRVDGKLLLQVSDITTLVSVALVIIRIIVGWWSTIVLWASGRYMLHRAAARTDRKTVSRMIRSKLPPWLQSVRKFPTDFPCWTLSVALLAVLIQAFISPILTGSINWNTTFRISNTAISVSSADPTANFGTWYWYNAQGAFDKRGYLRSAAGYASSAWADPSTVDLHGNSLVGNGCRHIVNDDALPRNSVLVDALLPCINVSSIRWYRLDDEISEDDWPVDGRQLTLVQDDPMYYYQSGVTVVFDVNRLRRGPDTSDRPPPADMFSGTMTVVLLVQRRNYERDPICQELPNTIFGDMRALPYTVRESISTAGDEKCSLIGKIDFTAGVTRSHRATYISPRLVEDTTPIEDVVYEPNPWVWEAIWTMPDLMTMLAVMNTSQVPTYNNIDNYVSSMVRQGYLGAWDMLSRGFDMPESAETYSAFPAEPRLLADVSFARVFTWLGLCLLMTLSGVLILGIVLRADDLTPPETLRGEERMRDVGPQTFLDLMLG